MPHQSPTTLTTDEQRLILRATEGNVRDHIIYSMALGTGLRLAEIVGLNVGDLFAPDGTPRVRVRVRAAIAKGGRAADVFLPDRLVAKLKRFRRWRRERGEDLAPDAPLFANQSGYSGPAILWAHATAPEPFIHALSCSSEAGIPGCPGWVRSGSSRARELSVVPHTPGVALHFRTEPGHARWLRNACLN